jgi:Reverse transcriptase (RNA-dependent DNA polymerase)
MSDVLSADVKQVGQGRYLDYLHPLAFAAKANSDDNPTFAEALYGPDAEGFYKAMVDEIRSLESMDPWDVVPIALAAGESILDSTWAFKCKRYPDGTVRKLMARWCIRGDQQIEGVDFFNTYAPVVAWSTVRLLLILTVTLGLAMKQVDYTLAFIKIDF